MIFCNFTSGIITPFVPPGTGPGTPPGFPPPGGSTPIDNPCSTVTCPPGKVCVVQQVQCFTVPCPKPTGECVNIAGPTFNAGPNY